MSRKRVTVSRILRGFAVLAVSVLGFVTIIATGGGGGGGGGTPGIQFTGITTEAQLTAGNAEPLPTGAFLGGTMASSPGLASVQLQEAEWPGIITIRNAFEKIAYTLDFGSSNPVAAAVQSVSDVVPGNCGGSMSYTLSADTVTGNYSGTMIFSAYCEDGVSLSGTVSVSGRVDPGTLIILTLDMNLGILDATFAGVSVSMSGSNSFSFSGPSASCSLDMRLRDNSTGKVFWTIYTMSSQTLLPGTDVEISMSGRYYDPDYGYVTVSTPTAFLFQGGAIWPSEGILTVAGKAGSAGGNTQARLTALPGATYLVDGDLDGDGFFDDWSSGVLNWQ